MNFCFRKFLPLFAVTITVLLMGGCLNLGEGSKPTRYYLLTPLEEKTANFPKNSLDSDLIIRVGPVKLAKYLDRPQILSHSGDNEIELAEFDRWAEPLRENVARVLAANLTLLIPTEKVILYPLVVPGEKSVQVTVEILKFDGRLGGEVALDARWVITGDGHAPLVPIKKSMFQTQVEGEDYGALVEAMSRALERLSVEIAKSL